MYGKTNLLSSGFILPKEALLSSGEFTLESFRSELTGKVQLARRTETEKMGLFTKQKSEVVAGTTDELFCEEKRPRFYVESRVQLRFPG